MRATLISWLDSLYAWLDVPPTNVPGDPQFRYWQEGKFWFYSLVAGNNEPLCNSSQGYANKAAVLRAIGQCKRNAAIGLVIGVEHAVKE